MDEQWQQYIDQWCKAAATADVDAGTLHDRVRASVDRGLIYLQYKSGASDRVLHNLLNGAAGLQ
jgi:hypothetical protein